MKEHNFLPGKIEKCQICGSKDLIQVIDLGNQPLSNTLQKNSKEREKLEKFPINVVRCGDCTLMQIDYIVDQSKVYHPDYPYLPGITKTVDMEQKELSDYLFEYLQLNVDETVLDIGSNDGSLLRYFKEKGLNAVGVENSLSAAISKAYSIVDRIDYENKYFRTDIGKKGIARIENG